MATTFLTASTCVVEPSVIMSGCPKPGCLARSYVLPGSNRPCGCPAHYLDWTWNECTEISWTKPRMGVIDALQKAGFPWVGEVQKHFRPSSSK